MNRRLYIRVFVCIYVFMYLYYICMYTCIYIGRYTFMYVYFYICKYTGQLARTSTNLMGQASLPSLIDNEARKIYENNWSLVGPYLKSTRSTNYYVGG